MKNLDKYINKIIEKRKHTNFRDFIKQIASWYPFAFYKRDGFITSYPQTDRVNQKLVNPIDFDEARDSLLENGINYDFSMDFFSNYQKLFKSIPMQNLVHYQAENSDFSDYVYNSKNSYLSNGVIHDCENVFYSFYVKLSCRNIFNSFMVWDNCENVYFGSGVINSYNIFYSRNIYNCSDIWFSSNLIGCRECIFCDSLENNKYCIRNKQYEKEDYYIEKEKILKYKQDFEKFYDDVKKDGLGPYSKNTTGRFTPLCEDVENGFFSYNVHGGRNVILMGSHEGNTEFYDTMCGGSPKGDNYFGCCYVGTYSENLYLCNSVSGSTNIFYSYWLEQCSNCLGCIGLKNKSYCILNKQYTKEKWYEMTEKILSKMEHDGILGEFFPGKLNPYYFNDTVAGMLGDFKKQEVEKDGFMWRDFEIKVDIPEESEIILTSPLTPLLRFNFEDSRASTPVSLILQERGATKKFISNYQGFDKNGDWQINPDIINKVIVDKNGEYYRIVKTEYDFLQKHKLPIPTIHWKTRIKKGLDL